MLTRPRFVELVFGLTTTARIVNRKLRRIQIQHLGERGLRKPQRRLVRWVVLIKVHRIGRGVDDHDALRPKLGHHGGDFGGELIDAFRGPAAPVFVPQVAEDDRSFARFKWIVDGGGVPVATAFERLDAGAQMESDSASGGGKAEGDGGEWQAFPNHGPYLNARVTIQ